MSHTSGFVWPDNYGSMGTISKYTNSLVRTLSPSQWTNIIWIIFGVLLYKLWFIPSGIALYKVIETFCHTYELFERTIIERTGILSRSRREVPYYRIVSVQMDQPWYLRIFGLSNIDILTSDPYVKNIRLKGVNEGEQLVGEIRDLVEHWRQVKNVREVNVD